MLRRKLFIYLGPLVVLFLITAIGAILILQGTIGNLSRVDDATPAVHIQEQAVRLRAIVLGLAVVFLLFLNVSVVVLLRMAGMILRPVDRLVAVTRLLGEGRFDARVEVDGHDEFGELAVAYNRLAEQLQAQERQRIETLGQVALALNHELNNCISVIDLQLVMLSRQASGSPGMERCLHQINASLRRMTGALESLKRVRRIVLTDYVPGTKMLDLERSAAREEQTGALPPDCPAAKAPLGAAAAVGPARA